MSSDKGGSDSMTRAELQERFEFRNVRAEEADQTIVIENICFPPNEACSPKSMTERASQAQETFLVAVDKETGKIAGFLNGIATDEEVFRDEFFTDIRLHNIKGKNILYNKIILLFHFQSFRNPVIYFLWRYMQTSLDLETKM